MVKVVCQVQVDPILVQVRHLPQIMEDLEEQSEDQRWGEEF
jgi:hypothetical protein